MRKVRDIIIYSDAGFYAAFPSIVSRSDGELIVAFRRAPERRPYGAPGCTHCDPNSYLVLVRSGDLGQTWSEEPELIHAHPLGGSQDPCMVELDDGALLVTSYAWMLIPPEGIESNGTNRGTRTSIWPFTFLGGYLLRSCDGGHTWDPPILPPRLADQALFFPGVPIPAWNRGAMCQTGDGKLYWAVACSPRDNPPQTRLELLTSTDRGTTWTHVGPIVSDEHVVFNETSLIETPGGHLVGFVRTANLDDHGVVIRSADRGQTWEWHDTGIVGHPYHATRLPDGRVFLVYGYRHPPYGIRGRILDPECTRFDGQEIVLRDDGGNTDIGYPWSCITADGRVLTVYYSHAQGGTRHIAGTFLEI
jgi:hypothetical protein